MEVYFYSLGMIPPLSQINPPQLPVFKDNNYMGLFIDQLNDFINKGTYSYLCSPLLLAIKALISKSPSLKQELLLSKSSLEKLVDIATKSFGSQTHKNLNISATALMSECSFSAFQSIISDKITDL